MRKRRPLLLALSCTTAALLSSCATPPPPAPPPLSYTAPKNSELSQAVALRLQQLPEAVRERLPADFIPHMQTVLSEPQNRTLAETMLVQLERSPRQLPLMAGNNLTLHHKSLYDQYNTAYVVNAPTSGEMQRPVVILLGLSETEMQNLTALDAWLLTIPSRSGMNYQLVAEGDLWHTLEDFYACYPKTRYAPTYLVGYEASADTALRLCNEYRWRFQGVAFAGGTGIIDLSNLNEKPIACFQSETTVAASPWGGAKVIERLQQNGNNQAFASADELLPVLQKLLQQPQNSQRIARYTFQDDHHAQVTPWLRVMARQNPDKPATVQGSLQEGELLLTTENVATLELDRTYPQAGLAQISYVRLNHALFPIEPEAQLAQIGTSDIPRTMANKADTPGGMLNFYRNEPLYIIYQDKELSPEMAVLCQQIATRFSTLSFEGLPPLHVKLPVIPLSQYHPNFLLPHRTLVIGKTEPLLRLVERPGGQLAALLPSAQAATAFCLNYPPERNHSLRLAMLLGANDLEGLQLLNQTFTAATSLFDRQDLRVWQKGTETTLCVTTQQFDSLWQPCTEKEISFSRIHKKTFMQVANQIAHHQ